MREVTDIEGACHGLRVGRRGVVEHGSKSKRVGMCCVRQMIYVSCVWVSSRLKRGGEIVNWVEKSSGALRSCLVVRGFVPPSNPDASGDECRARVTRVGAED